MAPTMCMEQPADPASALLIRWHRWSADPMMCSDACMREFDRVVGSLQPYLRTTLILEARNLACGSAVWSSPRVKSKRARANARSALLRALSSDQHKWFGREVVKYNERGNRIGESNPRAHLTDHEVDLMRELRDELKPDGKRKYSLGFLSLRFKVPKSTVQDICSGRRRAQIAARVREG